MWAAAMFGSVFDGHPGGGDGELAEARHASRLLALHEVLRVEAFDLAADLDVVPAVVAHRGPAKAGAALDAALPEGLDVVAEGREDAHAGYDHAPARRAGTHLASLPSRRPQRNPPPSRQDQTEPATRERRSRASAGPSLDSVVVAARVARRTTAT